jgi:hypothetical protein
MTKSKAIKRTEVYTANGTFPEPVYRHLPRMREIYHSLFDVDSHYDLSNLLKFRGEQVLIGLFFGANNDLGGFAISGVQPVGVESKKYAIFSAGVYSDLSYKLGYRLTWFAFKQAIQYKCKHPLHIQGYLQEALSPAPYRWSLLNTPECYPNPDKKTPDYIQSVIKEVAKERCYIRCDDTQFVVQFKTKRKLKHVAKLLNSKKMHLCKYFKHYVQLNPHFVQGDALLVYMPLTLKNIFLGSIKPILSMLKR